ncbi:MAG: hypothetical protein ACF788_01320 [Novipirellula sp. JB048]
MAARIAEPQIEGVEMLKFWRRISRTEELLLQVVQQQNEQNIQTASLLRQMIVQQERQNALLKTISLSDPAKINVSGFDEAIREMRNIIDLAKGQPFSALKIWVEEACDRQRVQDRMMDEMLQRWKSQVDDLQSQIPESVSA